MIVACGVLQENTILKTLNLSYNGLDTSGVSAVANSLRVNAVLTDIDLTACRINDIGLQTLTGALAVNEALRFLRVGNSKGIIMSDFTIHN